MCVNQFTICTMYTLHIIHNNITYVSSGVEMLTYKKKNNHVLLKIKLTDTHMTICQRDVYVHEKLNLPLYCSLIEWLTTLKLIIKNILFAFNFQLKM